MSDPVNCTDLSASGTFSLDADGSHQNVVGGVTGHTDANLLFTGSFTPPNDGTVDAVTIAVEQQLHPWAGGNAYGVTIYSFLVRAASGTHLFFESLGVTPPNISGGAATVQNATTLHVRGAPAAGVVNRALWVSSGRSDLSVLREVDGEAWTSYTPTVSADTGSWGAPTVNWARYRILGKTLFLNLYVSDTVASGSPNDMRISLPEGRSAGAHHLLPARVVNNGVAVLGAAQTQSSTYISPMLESGTFSGYASLAGSFVIELQ